MQIQYYRIEGAQLSPQPVQADAALLTRQPDDSLAWLDIMAFEPESLRQFLEPLDLHPLVVEDCLQPDENPKVIPHDNALFIHFPSPRDMESTGAPYLSIVCLPNLLISIHQQPIAVFERLASDLTGKSRLSGQRLSSLLYRLLASLVIQSATHGMTARNRIDQLAATLDESPAEIDIRDILHLKRQAGRLGVIWDDQLFCVAGLEHLDSPVFSIEHDRAYFHDLLENLRYGARFYARLETRLKDMHLQHMLSLQERSEKRLRLLTIISAVFLPLTLIAGIYGMNFEGMPELRWSHGYYGILALMLAIAGGLLLFFYRRGWFD